MFTADIYIKNGIVFQPSINFCGRASVIVKNGYIVDVTTKDTCIDAKKTIDAAGCFVFPGLIDFHTHLFNGGSEIGINPDAFLFPQGVTVAVDQGTSGLANFESFYKSVIAASEIKIFAFINVASSGLTTLPRCFENLDPSKIDCSKLKILLCKYKEYLKGLKIRTSSEIVGNLEYKPLAKTRELADKLHCKIVVHTTNAPGILSELTSYFNKGDVYAHVFQGRNNSIIDKDGKIALPIIFARDKGVVFDSADGRDHYSFNVIKQSFKNGFYPDIISSDLVRANVFDKAVFGLPLIMSKYINLGMPIQEVVKACTFTPAKMIGKDKELALLLPGTIADIAIVKLTDMNLQMKDVYNEILLCKKILITKVTIANGRIVYAQLDFTNNIKE